LKPEVWGWVCLQRRGDEKPRLVRISSSMAAKINIPSKAQLSSEKENTCQKVSDSSKHQLKMSRNNIKTCSSKIAPSSSSARKKKHSRQLLGSVKCSAETPKSLHVKDMLKFKLAKIAIPRSHGYSTTELQTGLQNGNKLVVPTNPFGPFRIKVNFSRKNNKSPGQNQPYNTPNTPGSMKCSRNISPMSLSSPSPRPERCPGLWNQ